MKVFISYSSPQLILAENIKKFLAEIGIDSFIANDDLRTASDWKEGIKEELKKCDAIIPILSKEFKESEWCSQEFGIFYLHDKKIIPISADETKPFGFIKHIQSKPVKGMSCELIIAEGLMECYNDFNAFIHLLKTAWNYGDAQLRFKAIVPYFDKISKSDLNSIIEISITNGQIWCAIDCAKTYIPKLLEIRKADIDPVLLEKIVYQLEKKEPYPKQS
jgi:hypothetical protein